MNLKKTVRQDLKLFGRMKNKEKIMAFVNAYLTEEEKAKFN